MAKSYLEFETTRVNYNLPTKLVERVKEYSRNNGVPITYGVVQLLNKGLENDTIMNYLPQLSKLTEILEEVKNNDREEKLKGFATNDINNIDLISRNYSERDN